MKFLKLSKALIFSLSSIFIFISCSNEDPEEIIIDPQTVLEEEQAETTQILSNANTKTWKITQATLTNDSGTFDISSNFNIVDDEFIFNTNGSLIWRPGNDINFEATSIQETLLDYYRSPINSTYNFNENSGTELTAINGNLLFEVINNNTITGILTINGNSGTELNVTLTNKEPQDYITAPTSLLNFTEVFSFTSNGIQGQAPGLICSYSDNSLFLVTRENYISGNAERVIKWDLATNNLIESSIESDDYVSKQIQIVNNQLVVVGGQYVNKYPLDLSSSPTTVSHQLAITRFGTGFMDDVAYIVGGDLDIDGDQNIEGEKIYKWDLNNQSLEYVTDLPEDRFGARSTIVNNKLYVFGGMTTFNTTGDPDPHNTIFIYDIENGGFVTEQMNTVAEYTQVDKYQNLIYVGGYQNIYDDEGTYIDSINTFGVYNTEDDTYQEIETNLNQQGYFVIHGMCVFNDKMYVIYRDFNIENSWKIMAADL